MIKVIENLNIDHNGNIYTPESIGYHSLYCKFIQKNIPFKTGSVIEEKTAGRPRTSNRERLQLYVQEKHVKMVRTFKQGLDIEEYIVKKVNEDQESDVKPYKFEDISFALIEFWVNHYNENKK